MNGMSRRKMLKTTLAGMAGLHILPARAQLDGPFDGDIVGGVRFEAQKSPLVSTVQGMTPKVNGPLDMVLCLCMDVSHSVRMAESDLVDEIRLQFEGTAAALESRGVIEAVKRAETGIGIVCTQFSDWARQSVGFAILRNEADVKHYAGLVRHSAIALPQRGTGISRGLSFSGAKMLQVRELLGYDFRRGVIDISGDGAQGPDEWYVNLPAIVRELAVHHGIVVNGMAIQSPHDSRDILAYYRKWVDTPAGFEFRRGNEKWGEPVVAGRSWSANSPEEFVRNMERKLQYEISGNDPGRRQRFAGVTTPSKA